MRKKTTQINTYAYLFKCANLTLGRIQSEEPYRDSNLTVYYTFLAMTVEAFLNHIGSETFDWWEESERGLNVKSKTRILLDHYGVKYEAGLEPFQTVNELVKFRNTIAHGKTQIVEQELRDGELPKKTDGLSDWETFIHHKDPVKVYYAVKGFALKLWEQTDKSKEFPNPFGWVRHSEEWPVNDLED